MYAGTSAYITYCHHHAAIKAMGKQRHAQIVSKTMKTVMKLILIFTWVCYR